MPNLRAMAVFHGPSGLPEDRIVNTFHFVSTGTWTDATLNADNAVANFYLTTGVGMANPVGGYLSPWVQRAWELRCYDLEVPKGERIPTIFPHTLGAAVSSTGMPEEVCVCLSYSAAPPNTARRRGRLFIGPLGTTAVTAASTAQPARPSLGFSGDLLKAAIALTAPALNTDWVIRSIRPSENFQTITHGYVDDALDTQRRRGPKTTARTAWTGIGV